MAPAKYYGGHKYLFQHLQLVHKSLLPLSTVEIVVGVRTIVGKESSGIVLSRLILKRGTVITLLAFFLLSLLLKLFLLLQHLLQSHFNQLHFIAILPLINEVCTLAHLYYLTEPLLLQPYLSCPLLSFVNRLAELMLSQ